MKTFLTSIALIPLIVFAGTALAADQAPAKTSATDLTIYHIEGRRSERIVWLCEELGLPYKLEFKRGDIAASMQTIRGVSPLMPVAPTVRIGDQVMVESGAIIQLILARQGKGRLEPAVASSDYPAYLTWMHFAEGSYASRIIADYRVVMIQGRQQPAAGRPRLVDSEAVLKYADDFLGKHPYFGGKEFSAADIMMVFPTNFAGNLNVVDMAQFPNVVAWKAKVEGRPAYKRMLAAARPDGLVGSPAALPKPSTK
ncbi:MAG TPA: glutathione binding-like protein [Steroidobacteraceae bacterium]|nr:glutathione binding-like protein [Steroidobacteraceae bacterium]